MHDYWDADYDDNYEFVENPYLAEEVALAYAEDGWDASPQFAISGPLSQPGQGVNPLILIFLALLIFSGFILVIPRGQSSLAVARPGLPAPTAAAPIPPSTGGLPANAFVAPYDDYWVTQGVHGASYGHMAVDIAGGKGAIIRAPIAGRVTENTIDGVGNTVLVLENDFYTVTFLHGNYAVQVGDVVSWGDEIGTESNIGYTMDMQGRLCTDRDCGYHTHLNVYDKQIGRNVDPLALLGNAAEKQLVVGSRVQRTIDAP